MALFPQSLSFGQVLGLATLSSLPHSMLLRGGWSPPFSESWVRETDVGATKSRLGFTLSVH